MSDARELARCEGGELIVLLLRERDASWLNVNRPVFAQLRLRVILWDDSEVVASMLGRAPDFFDWLSHVVELPVVLPRALLEAREAGRLIPFVGAGVSMAVRRLDGRQAFPSVSELLELAAQELDRQGRAEAAVVRAMLRQSPPAVVEAAKYARDGLGPLWSVLLGTSFGVPRSQIDDASLTLPRSIWGLGSDVVITTSYDRALAWSCPQPDDLVEWSVDVPRGMVEAQRRLTQQPPLALWHLYGSTTDPTRILFSPDGYFRLLPSEVHAVQFRSAEEVLRLSMLSHTLLFVGFSLAEPFAVRQIESVASRLAGCGGPHFMLARRLDVDAMRAKLAGLDLQFIEVEAFDEMAARLRALASATPEPTPRALVVGELAIDTVLAGRFTLLAQSAHGSFATVWKALDRVEHDIVAVKLLDLRLVSESHLVERFHQSVTALALLRHPGIVPVRQGPLEEDGHHFYVMPWRAGGDLRSAIQTGSLARHAALAATTDALEGLDYMHAAGLVHGEVKPSNILLDVEQRGAIADFDLLNRVEDTRGTRAGLGGVLYAAPELHDDGATADRRADVYGAAMCVLFVLLGTDPPLLVTLVAPGVLDTLPCSEGLREQLRHSLAHDKSERPGSCAPLVEALKHELVVSRPSLRSMGSSREPAWASSIEEDRHGRWMSFSLGRVEQRMRWIEAGTFVMGSPSDEVGRFDDEARPHEVTVGSGFWLADTPCTQALWRAVMANDPSHFESDLRPVEMISWDDAQTFLARLSGRLSGLETNLPTEAEWEYACRAGSRTATYAGPVEVRGLNDAPTLDDIAWYGGNSGVGWDLERGVDSSNWPQKQYPHTLSGTRVVAQKRPNPWGLYDMLGNVWEWCADAVPTHVLRGGAWDSQGREVRAAFRADAAPIVRLPNLGFRFVLRDAQLRTPPRRS